ncbi:MAG: hypothetical protein JXB05_13185 [Myxococcaceae bacterium]|nr:hypothetical protein [Myxococcaceae bacterium]
MIAIALWAGACAEEPRPPEPERPEAARSALTSQEAQAEADGAAVVATAPMVDACSDVVAESAAPGWVAGPLVSAGTPASAAFAAQEGEWGLVALQNGDGWGQGAAAIAEARLGGDVVARALFNDKLVAAPVRLSTSNQLEVRAIGGGSARATVARLAELPCTLAELTVTGGKGHPRRVTRTFPRPDADALGVLVVEVEGGPRTAGEVLLNGRRVLRLSKHGKESRPLALTVSLRQTNTLEVVLRGGRRSVVRVRVVDADTLAPLVAITTPASGAEVADSPVEVSGTMGLEAATVEVSGVTATLGAGSFSASVPLTPGINPLVAAARDACGNVRRACHWVRMDADPPVVTVSGVADGEVRRGPLTASWSVEDAHLASVEAWLDDQPVTGTSVTVTAEGSHVLRVRATDAGGLETEVRVAFVIDDTPPVLTLTGVTDGQHSNAEQLVPSFSATDASGEPTLEARLDGQPFTSGTPVSAEGTHQLELTARDAAGNSESRTVVFTLDRVAPTLQVSGVLDGEFRRVPATIQFAAQDDHPAQVSATLDGSAFESGGIVQGEGLHTLVVTAADRAGNTAVLQRVFTIDTSAPVIQVQSPSSGLVTSQAQVELVVAVQDTAPVVSVAVGGEELVEGVDGVWRRSVPLLEGTNQLVISVLDAAGNSASTSLSVLRDSTPPQLSVTSPSEGTRVGALSIRVRGTTTDATPVVLRVNGAAVTVGNDGAFDVEQALVQGANTLRLVATDAAGNVTEQELQVRANAQPPTLGITEPVDGTVTEASSVTVRGVATPADSSDSVVVVVAGSMAAVSPEGSFLRTVQLAPGAQTLTVVAMDGYGLRSQASVSITRRAGSSDGGATDGGLPQEPEDGGAGGGTPPADAGIPSPDAGGEVPPPVILVDLPTQDAVLGGSSVAVVGRVEGGSLPLTVTLNGESAAVTGRSFRASLALPEGNHQVTVVVTDAEGRSASAARAFSVDRTDPHLLITRPAQSPATVSESPYLLRGEAGDLHLAGVSVQGHPVTVMGGHFSTSVPLAQGSNAVEVVAVDLAGNQTRHVVTLTVEGAPPLVTVLEPASGGEASSPVVQVRAKVVAYAALAEVRIGTGLATEGAPGEYSAQVPLMLGENTIEVSATDVRGLTGTARVVVRYRDPSTEPLAVTGVLPAQGARDVKTDSLVSVSFNKAVRSDSVREGFQVLHRGARLAGGYSIAPGGQTVSFIANAPLPEGEVLQVQVADVEAVVGPGQSSTFMSELTVRRPLTRVRGYVMDEAFQPLPGVRVVLEGTDESTRTAADGNWALITAAAGPTVVRFEGGSTAEGRPLHTVRRRLQITPEEETVAPSLVLSSVDMASASLVDATAALHADFAGRHGALALDGPPGSLLFEDGSTQGVLTATRLEPVALPIPLESSMTPTALWQLGPAGVRLQNPVMLRFPNTTGLAPGRWAVVLAHDPQRHVLARMGLARVSADGVSVRAEEPLALRSVELVGYMALTQEQHEALEQALANTGGAGLPDGGMQGALPRWISPPGQPPPAPLWRRALDLLVGEAHAQALLGLFPFLDQMIQDSVPGLVIGQVRAPQDRQLSLQLTEETLNFIAVPREVRFPYSLRVAFSARRVVVGLASSELIDASLEAQSEEGVIIAPPLGEDWTASTTEGEEEVLLSGNVELVRGVTLITLRGRMGSELRTTVLKVTATPVADAGTEPDGGDGDSYLLHFAREEAASAGATDLQSVVRFPGVRVTVTGPGAEMSGVTGQRGEYGIPVLVPAGEAMGISCTEIPMGPRHILMRDESAAEGSFQATVLASHAACSPTYTAAAGRQVRADILIDARLLHGALHFVDREGRSLSRECDPELGSALDGGFYTSISDEDIARTEVHFFRADNLEIPIARYTVGAPSSGCEQSTPEFRVPQGRYSRVRVGPTGLVKRNIREWCRIANPDFLKDPSAPLPADAGVSDEGRDYYERECRESRTNFLRLSAGDPLVVVAVNHATGHTGMTRVTVPPIVTSQLNADGKCAQDEELGPLEVTEAGETILLSRCSVSELGIEAPIYLFPPELDVRVWRGAKAGGVRQDAPPTLVRNGGAATTGDSYLHLDTHWRVRTMAPLEWRAEDGGVLEEPVDAGLPPDRVDGGLPPCRDPQYADGGLPDGGLSDGGLVPCTPGSIRDDGVSGILLETCSEYGAGAASSTTKQTACLRSQDLQDVPPGVPPLAGRIWRVTGTALEEPVVAQFAVLPGRGSAAVEASMNISTPSGQQVVLNNLLRRNFYVHVVGREVLPRDENGDGVLQAGELNEPPPDFSEPEQEEHPAGLPEHAVMLKGVYSSLDPDGYRVLRYDRAREHEFRVLELKDSKVMAHGSTASRQLEGEDAAADLDDLAYELLATLIEPDTEGRAGTLSGDYVVRFGSDDFGVECDVEIDEETHALTGSCDNEFIDDVLSANDLLYVELYLSGNAENVLYRFNLMGVSPRVDLLKAGSDFTAQRAVEADANGRSVTDRPVSLPAFARFALDPGVIQRGTIKVCTSDTCGAEQVVKEATVERLPDASYRVVERPDGMAEHKLEQLEELGLNGARRFQLQLPPKLVPMPGSGQVPTRLYLVQQIEEPEPRRLVQRLGQPRGFFEGLHARAPGQESLEGINVADGHVSFEHEDFAVPQLAEVVRFARTYNNQSSLVSPTGVGWVHNYDGFVQEEKPGRYTAILAGQAYDFPTCATVDVEAHTASDCDTDGSHGMSLRVEKRDGRLLAILEMPSGSVYEFGTRPRGRSPEEPMRWLLDRYHDGHGRSGDEGWTKLTYKPETNLLETVERIPGRLRLEFTYAAIELEDDTVAYRLRNMARNQGFALLDKVKLVLKEQGGATLHTLDFTHDKRGNLERVTRTSALPAVQEWEYEYEPLPSGLSGQALWAASNELKEARLKHSPPTGGQLRVQWRATFSREAQPGKYAHVSRYEAVTSIVGSGVPAPGLRIEAPSATERIVKRPDGVEISLDLNEYGNTRSVELPGLNPGTLAWGSEQRGGPVQLDTSVSPAGFGLRNGVSAHLQLDKVTIEAAPSGSLPAPGAEVGQSLWEVKGRHQGAKGRIIAMQLSTGSGPASVSRPRSPAGDPMGVTVTDPKSGVVFATEQLPDLEGVVQSGVDPSGNDVTFSGHDQQPLGLPRFVKVSRLDYAEGGLPGYTLEYEYDALGRRISEYNQTTGARVQLQYDAIGRLLSRSVYGVPSQAWTYDYVLSDDEITITETLELGRYGRSQTRKTEYRYGLKRSESYHYGEGGTLATIHYDEYEGDRLVSYRDARGYKHELSYDSAGRLTGETVDGKPLYSRLLDADGKVTQTTNSDGLKTHIRYDTLGRAVRWEYESLVSADPGCTGEGCGSTDVETVVLDATGGVVERKFGTLAKPHHLVSTTDAMGRERTVKSGQESLGGINAETFYDGAGRPTRRVDHELGLEEVYEYRDVLGRITRFERTVQSPDGPRKLVETRLYSDAPEGLGTVEVRRAFEGGAGSASRGTEVRTYTVDTLGRVLKVAETVDGQAAEHLWDYDALGRESAYRDPAGRLTTYEYDSAGNLLAVIKPGDIRIEYTPDAEGNVLVQRGPHEEETWTMEYEPVGRLEKRTLAASSTTPAAVWQYSYPGSGVEVEIDPQGTTITRTRNARGLVELEVWTGSDGGERSTRTKYDATWVKRQLTSEGSWTRLVDRTGAGAIDDRGRTRLELESWTGTGGSYLYTTTTGWSGRAATVTELWQMGGRELGGRTVRTEVDSLGNVVRHLQGSAEDRWEYYADGKPMKAQPFGYAAAAATSWVYEASGRVKEERFGPEVTSYSYFKDGLPRAMQGPDGRLRERTYNARGLVEAESYGRQGEGLSRTRYEAYDQAGNPTRVTRAEGTPDASTWLYKYGPRGELQQVTQPGDLSTFTYKYDALARLKTVEPPAGSTMPQQEFAYDFLGRETLRKRGTAAWSTTWTDGGSEISNELGERVVRLFDGRGRVAREVFKPGPARPDASGVERIFKDLESVDYVFNGLDQPRFAIEKREAGTVTNSFTYDARDRLEVVSRGAEEVRYGYHASGELKSIQSPAGLVGYEVDGLQRLSQVKLADGTQLDVEWESGGARVAYIGNASFKQTYCYDARGRSASVTHDASRENCSSPMASPRLRYAYSYDERDNRLTEVVSRQEAGGTETTSYGYDAADRLTGVRYPDGKAVLYRLHKDGSRHAEKYADGYSGPLNEGGFDAVTQPQKHLVYAYDELGGLKEIRDEVAAHVVAEFQTDRVGRLVRETRGGLTRLMHFDAAGRLVEVESTEAGLLRQVKYRYDYAGLRREKTAGSATTRYLWSGETLVEEQLPSADSLLYQRAAGLVVAAGGERILSDALGSAVGRLSASGALTTSSFDAWGGYRGGFVPSNTTASIGFTGHAYDADAGLVYAQQRWYDSASGTFISEDPVGAQAYLATPQGLNQWMYANGNPLRYTDPTGERAANELEQQHIDLVNAMAEDPWNFLNKSKLRNYLERFEAAIERAGDDEPVIQTSLTDALDICLPTTGAAITRPCGNDREYTLVRDPNSGSYLNFRIAAGYATGREVWGAINLALLEESYEKSAIGIYRDFENLILPLAEKRVAMGQKGKRPGRSPSRAKKARKALEAIDGTERTERRAAQAKAAVEPGTSATVVPGADDYITFAHGTSLDYARNIKENGVSRERSLESMTGSHTPGSLFTHLIGPPSNPGPGFQEAANWATPRFGRRSAILIGRIPRAEYEELVRKGWVKTQPVPGGTPDMPHETIFAPEANATLNKHRSKWQVLPLFKTEE